ncbi:MAG: hypothetical protein Q4C50_02820 [Eubacteriales bacterium]|nr:hypothetical protein [Eubacteriales bacterium]
MNERKDFSKSKIVISVTVGLVAEFIYYFYGSKWSAERIIGNIQIYVIGTLIFFIAYMVALFIVARAGEHTLSPVLRTVCLLAVISFSVVYFFRVFKSETENYPQIPLGYFRHMIPGTVYAIVLVLCVMLVYSKAIKCDIRGGVRKDERDFYSTYCFRSGMVFVLPESFRG